ncbi:hypothetical protein GFC01_09495 [Desulfofundulus thermobenzoicus]|uniref:Uncharacterized protein n=1 Tax=Desulfofundulus thermobenzoicus TaxID=29376 RepID=A0A6N7IR29_9FIRM|nr:hypothetical protein [Desulfofundulus thermobenzoicus]MQL52490.1 hypothetical protein [Desulfofundulus thermobenzoicus]HHW43553.1 hypothetical protein [Desulfotomaculum sp.]
MGRDPEEIVAELMSRLPHYRDDPYCRGVWDGAMMVIAHYDRDFPDELDDKIAGTVMLLAAPSTQYIN